MDLAVRPSTLPCGHTACRSCLNAAFSQGCAAQQKRCPTCRAIVPVGAPALALNTTLKALAELLLPGGCQGGRRVLGGRGCELLSCGSGCRWVGGCCLPTSPTCHPCPAPNRRVQGARRAHSARPPAPGRLLAARADQHRRSRRQVGAASGSCLWEQWAAAARQAGRSKEGPAPNIQVPGGRCQSVTIACVFSASAHAACTPRARSPLRRRAARWRASTR